MVDADSRSQKTIEHRKSQSNDEPIIEHLKGEILSRLGTPPNLQHIVVKRLWDDYYRVNVVCTHATQGDLLALSQLEITDSFFVRASPEGGVLRAEPPIVRKYE
jgi:hypothetical protein